MSVESLIYRYIDNGAGDGNRTHATSLEGWCSTIELHPRHSQCLYILSKIFGNVKRFYGVLKKNSNFFFTDNYSIFYRFYRLNLAFLTIWNPTSSDLFSIPVKNNPNPVKPQDRVSAKSVNGIKNYKPLYLPSRGVKRKASRLSRYT